MGRLRSIADTTSATLSVIAGVALIAIALLVTSNTITRKTPLGPILGTYEFTTYLEGMVIAFALAYNQIRKANISVEILVQHLSRRIQAILSSIVYLLSLVLFSVIVWAVAKYGVTLWQQHTVSPTLNFAYYPFVYAVALCLFLLASVILLDFIDSLTEIWKKNE